MFWAREQVIEYIDDCQYTPARRNVEGMQRGSAAAPFDGGRFRFPIPVPFRQTVRDGDVKTVKLPRQNAIFVEKSDGRERPDSELSSSPEKNISNTGHDNSAHSARGR